MNATLSAATQYTRRGWRVVPIPHGQKKPQIKGWPDWRLDESDLADEFDTPMNVGVLLGEPSEWLVDVDLDHPLAVALADTYLPATRAVFGHSGKPRSHRLYYLTGPVKTTKFTHPVDGMLVELRSTGAQTVFPPSLHPSGESVSWSLECWGGLSPQVAAIQGVDVAEGAVSEIHPATVAPDDLLAAVMALATAVRAERGEAAPEGPAHVFSQGSGRSSPGGRSRGGYASAALGLEVQAVRSAAAGVRNDTLNKAAFNLGQLVAGGVLEGQTVEVDLLAAAESAGLSEGEARRTIASGLTGGAEHPRGVPAPATGAAKPKFLSPCDPPRSRTPRKGSIASFQPFPVEVLPEPVRSFVRAATEAIGCDSSMVAIPALVMLAACIGDSRRVILKSGWVEPSILWGAVVCESGSLKSPAFRHVLRPLKAAQRRAIADHAKAMQEFKAQAERHKRQMAEWKAAGAQGDPPREPDEPSMRRHIVSDVTVEAMAPILLANPRGVLCERDELAGWVGSFDRYANGRGSDASHWLSMYDGESVMVDRKTGPQRTIYVPSTAVSVVGTIQPGVLARSFTQEHRDSGLLARLLLAMPPTRPALWSDAELTDADEALLAGLVAGLLDLEPERDALGDPRPKLMPLTDGAMEHWILWQNAHALDVADECGDLAAAFAKIKGVAPRLALVLHLVRWVAGDPALEHPGRIDRASIEAATRLADWFKLEAVRVYGALAEDDDARDRRRLLEWSQRRGEPVTARDLSRGPRRYRGDPEAAEQMLVSMVEAGLGRWVDLDPGAEGGRPARGFVALVGAAGDETPSKPELQAVPSPSPLEEGEGADADGVSHDP